jgi:hypothetical protein
MISSLLHLLATKVFAQGIPAIPPPPCGPLPGCGSGPVNVATDALLPEVARILLNTAAGFSVLFVIIGGARYVLSFARENEQQKAKMTIFWALVGLVIALTSHRIVMLVITEPWITNPADPIFSLIQSAIRVLLTLLNITFLLVIVLGGMRMVYARGAEDEVKKGRDMVIYAILGVVIINAAPFVVQAVLAL